MKPTKKDQIVLSEVTCPICLSVMVKPVKMPCNHAMCLQCFELNVSEANLFCPLCRKRISVWVRKMRKTNDLVDKDMWNCIKENFKNELEARSKGEDKNNSFTSEVPHRILSSPGEINEEFQRQLRKIRGELEDRNKQEEDLSNLFIKQMQDEETKRLEELKEERNKFYEKDRIFAQKLRESQFRELLKKRENKRIPNENISASSLDCYIISPNKPSTSSSSHSRTLQDITASHSSESESECDSSENIKKSHADKTAKNTKVKRAYREDDVPKSDVWSKSNDAISDSELILDSLFNENKMENEHLSTVIEEQRLLEQRIRQEQEDRALALRLQQQFKQVDRSKGSEDEYGLRNLSNSTTITPPRRQTKKYRQTTLIESLSKRQRRL